MSGEFCDTNIIVYAFDLSAGEKLVQAQRLLDRLWTTKSGIVSMQVLQELFASLTRKLSPQFTASEARRVVVNFSRWQVVEPTRREVLEAIDLSVRWNISFWDGMILATAQKAGATVLWSEDLNDGQEFNGIVVRNPFQSSSW